MTTSDDSKNARKLDSRYITLVKNTLFSIIISYGTFLFSLVTSFLFARMITRTEWGVLILATSIVGIFSIIVNFLPPGIIFAMNFYIPRYRAKKEISKLRDFILKTLYMRIFGITVIFLIAMILFWVFATNFNIFLNNHLSLLYILSLLIIFSNIDVYFGAFLIGFNLFKTNLIIFLTRTLVNLIPLLIYFIVLRTITIEMIAFINIISYIVPLIIEFSIFILKFPKLDSEQKEKLGFLKVARKILAYGSFLRIENLMSDLWRETQTQAIGIYENKELVTGYSISRNYTRISNFFLGSLTSPLIYSFSSLDYKIDYDKIIKIFKTIINYSLYIFLLLTGVLFILAEFFLDFIYGGNYVQYSPLIKLLFISAIISLYPSLFGVLLRSTNKIKLLAITAMIAFPINIVFVFIGLIFFGIYGMLYAIIIFNILVFIVDMILTKRIMKITLEYKKMLLLYLSFIIAIFLTITLNSLLFENINTQIWILFELPIFKYFNFLNLLTFLISFLTLNIAFKCFSKKDLENIELLFTGDKLAHKFIKKILRFLKRFLR